MFGCPLGSRFPLGVAKVSVDKLRAPLYFPSSLYLSAPKMVQILVIPSSSGATGTVRDAVKLSNRQLGAFSQFTASMGTSYDFELAI